MSDQRSSWVSLRSADLSVDVDPLGAQLSVLRDRDGHDLLWGGDPAVWSGRAPLLFPIVGALSAGFYRLGSRPYPLSRHGFARGKLFDVVQSAASGASLRLKADATTLSIYPFDFELRVDFRLAGPTLTISAHVRNLGSTDMPASFGYHPALRWPLPYGQARSAHFIEFAAEEPAPIRRLDAAGLLTAERHPTLVAQRRLALADALFDDDAVIFDALQSRAVTYGAAGGPRLQLSFPDSPYLGVWSKPGAGFVCIEPWHGVADPVGFAGDFRSKPGVFTVAAGAASTIDMAITWLAR